MEIRYTKEFDKSKMPNSITRFHIWPGNILIGFIVPVCSCHSRKDNHFGYCENCGFAIPDEKERQEFKVK